MSDGRECLTCHRHLPADSFYPNPAALQGLNSRCKECCKVERAKHRERKAEYDRQRRLADPAAAQARKTDWRKRNLEKAREKERAYVAQHVQDIAERKRQWAKDNHSHLRDLTLRGAYGITLREFEEMDKAQGGVCAICRKKPGPESKGVLHVDHCHATGRVRGLLCSPCNRGIGALGDDTDRLRSAIEYLERQHGSDRDSGAA